MTRRMAALTIATSVSSAKPMFSAVRLCGLSCRKAETYAASRERASSIVPGRRWQLPRDCVSDMLSACTILTKSRTVRLANCRNCR